MKPCFIYFHNKQTIIDKGCHSFAKKALQARDSMGNRPFVPDNRLVQAPLSHFPPYSFHFHSIEGLF